MGANISQKCCYTLRRCFSRPAVDRGRSETFSLPPLLSGNSGIYDSQVLLHPATTQDLSSNSTQFVTPPESPKNRALSDQSTSVDNFPEDDGAAFGSAIENVIRMPTLPQFKQRKKTVSKNSNRISHYAWLLDLLHSIAHTGAQNIARVISSGQLASPLFVVAGACPNPVCGMQAMMYAQVQQTVLFWWVKPQANNTAAFERSTLNLNSHGEFKNDVGRAKAVYEPLAHKFKGAVDGFFTFNIDRVSGRAYIDEKDETGITERLFLFFVWQESWSSMMARKKFMKGKLFYQKQDRDRYFARQYEILDGQVFIMEAAAEEEVPTLLPPDIFQQLFESLA